jgi:hypothetical protein
MKIENLVIPYSEISENDDSNVNPDNFTFVWKKYSEDLINIFHPQLLSDIDYSITEEAIISQIQNINDFCTSVMKTYRFELKQPIFIFLIPKDLSKVFTGKYEASYNYRKRKILYSIYKPLFNEKYNKKLPFSFHEIVHAIQADSIRYCYDRPILEGFAVFLDGVYGQDGNKVDTYKSYIDYGKEYLSSNNLLTIQDLLLDNNIVHYLFYPQAALFIDFIINNYGIEKYIELYRMRTKDILLEINSLFGKSINELEIEYKEYLNQILS